MEGMLTKKATAAGCMMEVTVMKIGEDFQICLAGGEKPHIGCVVQAVPRESLTGDGAGVRLPRYGTAPDIKMRYCAGCWRKKSVVPAVP